MDLVSENGRASAGSWDYESISAHRFVAAPETALEAGLPADAADAVVPPDTTARVIPPPTRKPARVMPTPQRNHLGRGRWPAGAEPG